jgi:hypothetical protein
MKYWRKQALFSPPAVGSQQKRKTEIHLDKDRRRQKNRKAGVVLQGSGRIQTSVLSISKEQEQAVEV